MWSSEPSEFGPEPGDPRSVAGTMRTLYSTQTMYTPYNHHRASSTTLSRILHYSSAGPPIATGHGHHTHRIGRGASGHSRRHMRSDIRASRRASYHPVSHRRHCRGHSSVHRDYEEFVQR